MSRLRLDASKTYKGFSGRGIYVSPDDPIRISVTVAGEDVPEGSIQLIWDDLAAELIEGKSPVSLPAGTYEKTMEWVLKSKITTGKILFEIHAKAGPLPQAAVIPIEIKSTSVH